MTLAFSAVAFLAAIIVVTSFLSGVLGMAGGMILMGVLVYLLPVPAAMILHGATQLSANGWRVVLWWRYVEHRIVVRFAIGAVAALGLFSAIVFVPDKATVLIALGLVPFVSLALPERHSPRIDRRFAAEISGFLCGSLQLLSGVSGPILDVFFVRMPADRRMVVATKAACQVVGHALKLVYFGAIALSSDSEVGIPLVVMAMGLAVLGTSLARSVLERLTDHQFRRWTRLIVLAIGAVYVVEGVAIGLG